MESSMKNTLFASSMLVSSLVFGACVAADDVADDPDVDSSGAAIEACAAVHIITARASTEAPGEGITGALVDQIIERSPDSVAATKKLIYGNRHRSLRGAYRLERRLQSAMFKSKNTAIARKAGAAKETPVFGPRTFGS
jgi:enoyl-CoA hydratase/carnithine racemase